MFGTVRRSLLRILLTFLAPWLGGLRGYFQTDYGQFIATPQWHELAVLHRRAATWFEAQGLIEKAICHAMEGDGPGEAGRLMGRHRKHILNGEQWRRLEQWLRRMPAKIVENDHELRMLKSVRS